MAHAHDAEPNGVSREQVSPPSRSIKRTRASGTWVAVVIALVVLALLLIFILRNLQTVAINFLGMEGSMPLGVAMLVAALGGGVLVALVGAARILQLRRATKKAHKALR
jgi:uncharacterized integral membrane protein